jgi:hypothetical protein
LSRLDTIKDYEPCSNARDAHCPYVSYQGRGQYLCNIPLMQIVL